jgi:hypothetical protein
MSEMTFRVANRHRVEWYCEDELMAAKRAASRTSRPATRAAASIGSALSSVALRVDNWLAQREDLAEELDAVIGRAQSMLASLSEEATDAERRATRTARKTVKATRRKVAEAKRAARKNGKG